MPVANVIPLGAIPPAPDPHSVLLDLQRRMDAGADIGSRVEHIKGAMAAMRAYAGGLRRLLEAPDEGLSANPALMAHAESAIALTERSVASAEAFLSSLGGDRH